MKEFRLADEVSGEELRERFTSEICRFLPTVPFFEAVGRGGGLGDFFLQWVWGLRGV